MLTRFIGLMSGTSLDGVDGVVLTTDGPSLRVVASHHQPMPAALRQAFMALNSPGANELHRAALAANDLAQVYAQTVHALLATGELTARDITAIGAHGQTVRHQPGAPGLRPSVHAPWTAYTLQINQPALLAELTGIPVVADFRGRDVAAGGQGAPLVPAFHQAAFASGGKDTVVVNVGGMANATVLRASGHVEGFDTGPGNVLMDLWCERHTGLPFDADGQWAASGRVVPALLTQLQSDPYFALSGPRSTGRDHFNAPWLQAQLHAVAGLGTDTRSPSDVQATLCALTAWSIARTVPATTTQVVVCGGGVFNRCLMALLAAQLSCPVVPSDALGMPAMQVEAAAFAWLARQTWLGLPGNVTAVTGATGPRVLGAIHPA